MRRRAPGALAAGLLIAFLSIGADGARAGVDCVRSGALLEVELGAGGDVMVMGVDAGEIKVNSGAIPCSGGTPTTTNIDRIKIRDTSEGGTYVFVAAGGGLYAPGASDAGDVDPGIFINPDEIEISVRMGPGSQDRFQYGASALEDNLRWGTDGLNFNVHDTLVQIDDADLTVKGAESLDLTPGNAADIASADGGAGTGDPLRQGLRIEDIFGGDDQFTGGDGDDLLVGGPGGDLLAGGRGRDAVEYLDSFSGPDPDVRASIGVGSGDDGSEDDGAPGDRDTITGTVEDLIGDNGDDRLIGDDRSNRLTGRRGKDTFKGRGGGDNLRARDNKKDALINCGPGGGDSAAVDPQDPSPISC